MLGPTAVTAFSKKNVQPQAMLSLEMLDYRNPGRSPIRFVQRFLSAADGAAVGGCSVTERVIDELF